MVGQQGEGTGVAADVIFGRRSHAVLGRVHARGHRRPDRVRTGGTHGGQRHRRSRREEAGEIRQPASGRARPDVVERCAVEQDHHDARARDRQGGRGLPRWRQLGSRGHCRTTCRHGERQRSKHRNRQQGGADTAAPTAERVVRRRQPDEDQRGPRRRGRSRGHAARRALAERRRKPRDVEPHQDRRPRRQRRRQPGEDAHAHPAGRQPIETDELAADHQQVEHHREVHAVEQGQRHEQPPGRGGEQRDARVELQHDDGEKRRTKRAGEQRVGQHPQEPHNPKCILRVCLATSTPSCDPTRGSPTSTVC